jgi:hypothetical protein
MELPAPNIKYGRTNLDFGQGFYVTALKEQAEKWAVRRTVKKGMDALKFIESYRLEV